MLEPPLDPDLARTASQNSQTSAAARMGLLLLFRTLFSLLGQTGGLLQMAHQSATHREEANRDHERPEERSTTQIRKNEKSEWQHVILWRRHMSALSRAVRLYEHHLWVLCLVHTSYAPEKHCRR